MGELQLHGAFVVPRGMHMGYGMNGELDLEFDCEDDATSASYDAFSRFGSIASIAGSESSNTSAHYSDSEIQYKDVGDAVDLGMRRASQ
jgi:hypothetical protein